MQEGPSNLSFLASGLYVVVAVASLFAFKTAKTKGQDKWHGLIWVFVTVFFVCVAIGRVFEIEESVKTHLREWIRSEELLDDRRFFQGLIVAIAIPSFVASCFYARFMLVRFKTGRRHLALALAVTACAGMTFLIFLRIISLHSLDKLLFGAPKLSWFGDLGSTALAGVAACYYSVRVMEQSIRREPR